MAEKAGKGLLLFLNGLGLVCLVYYGRLLILHEPEVLNPDAMLPMAGWEAGGLALTIGLVPLLAVNLLAFMVLGKGERAKRIRILFFLPGLLCFFLVIWFWTLSLSEPQTGGQAQAVVKIRLEDEGGGNPRFGCLYEDGGLEMPVGEFEPDPIKEYVCDGTCFLSEIEGDRVTNRLPEAVLTDKAGRPVQADETVLRILKKAADCTDHAIWKVRILEDRQTFFAEIKTNVNWQDPSLFYRWDEEKGELQLLYEWDGADVTGIALP